MKRASLGTAGNSIAGALGGLGGGQLLEALVPVIAGAAGGDLDLGSIVGQLAGGGAGRNKLCQLYRSRANRPGRFICSFDRETL
jgi:hypothetical protein